MPFFALSSLPYALRAFCAASALLVLVGLATGCVALKTHEVALAEVATLRQQNVTLERRAAVAEAAAARLGRERQETEESLQGELERRIREGENRIAEMAQREGRLLGDVDRLRAELETARGQIDDLTQQIDEAGQVRQGLEGQLSQERQSAQSLTSRLQEAQAAITRLETEKAMAERLLTQNRERIAGLESQLEAARRDLETARAIPAATPVPTPAPALTTPPAIEAARQLNEIARRELLPLIQGIGGSVELRIDEVAVVVPSAALFESGVVDVSPTGRRLLKALGERIKGMPIADMAVAGHTDNQPIQTLPFYNNTELSFRRAFAATLILAEEAGVPEGWLRVEAWGQHRPIDSNHSVAGRAKNRRVELVLKPSLAPAPRGG